MKKIEVKKIIFDDDNKEIIVTEQIEVSEEELANEQKRIEDERIIKIKAKAREVIEETYPAYKQHNVLMSGVTVDIANMNQYITNIRNISNEAEANGTALEDINWQI